MPSYKPGGTIPIVLDCDADEQYPLTFIVTALSVNQSNELASSLAALLEEKLTENERRERLFAIVCPLIHGWKNTETPYSWSALCDAINMEDLWSLAYAIKRQMGYREKKA